MYIISDRIQTLYGDSEYCIYLKLLMEALCLYEEEENNRYNRKFEDFNGYERCFVTNLRTPIKYLLDKNEAVPQVINVECEFNKNAQDYATNFCNSSNQEVNAKFESMLKKEENSNGMFSPDLIIHSPNNMLNQVLYLEAKFERNQDWYGDFEKITKFIEACYYLKDYVDKDHNPLFFFHVFLFIGGSLKNKISEAHAKTQKEIAKCNQDIICIDKEKDTWYCRTIKEILDE